MALRSASVGAAGGGVRAAAPHAETSGSAATAASAASISLRVRSPWAVGAFDISEGSVPGVRGDNARNRMKSTTRWMEALE